jgi:dienelactone hydrolase
MQWNRLASALVAVVACGFAARPAAAEDVDLLRVYPAGQRPDDPRYVLNSIDKPADFTGRFADRAAWEARADVLRRQVLVAAGLWPMPEKTPLNAVVFGSIDRGDYTVEKVYFASQPGHYVTGNLYRPKSKTQAKRPAVLCPYGHWPDGRFMWTSDVAAKKEVAAGAEDALAGAHSPLQARCASLARLGCVVFHYDMVGVADSNKLTHRRGMTDVDSVLRLQSQMGLQTWNSIRAVDFVTSLPDVDATRVGVTGASGGGTQTFVLTAVEPRVTAAFPAVMVGMNMQGGCVCENAPLLRVGTNNVELTALAAPRPVAMSAANDWTKDLETRGLPELKLIYKLYGAEDAVAAKHFSFPHNYNQRAREMMYGWFDKHLKLDRAAAPHPAGAELPFEPVPPKELAVWDATHPVPPDALDVDALRRSMTATSDKQMAALAADPPAYRTVVGPALEAMLVSRYPGPQGVRVSRHSGPMRRGEMSVERGAVERVADGTKVPYVAGVPDGWDGRVVVWATERGKASVRDADGNPTPALAALMAAKVAVIVPDLYWTGEFLTAAGGNAAEGNAAKGKQGEGKPNAAPANPTYAPKSNPPYAAFNLGYNRSVVGNRVHDLLAVVAMARGWAEAKSVHVLATGKAGPVGLLAKAAAGDAVERLAADLGGFDFDKVDGEADEMLLPGALKYGGIYGFVPLFGPGDALLTSARKAGRFDPAAKVTGVTLEEAGRSDADLAAWLVK